jgi:hypothetical protein
MDFFSREEKEQRRRSAFSNISLKTQMEIGSFSIIGWSHEMEPIEIEI